MKLPKISQSLMKSYTDYYNNKECGLVFKAKYIDKNYPDSPSEAMKLGIYFEYLCTGMLPKSGIVPTPNRLKSGELTEPYKKVEQSAALFKKILVHYQIRILKVGLYLEGNDTNGLLDIWALWNDKKCIIDLKFSGLLDDKWNELGWETESLPTKDSLMIQGVHYKLLAREVMGEDNVPFYYFVFNSANPEDMKIIHQIVDEERFASHRVAISEVKRRLEISMTRGFQPLSEYRRCKACPLYANCESRTEMPQIENVHY